MYLSLQDFGQIDLVKRLIAAAVINFQAAPTKDLAFEAGVKLRLGFSLVPWKPGHREIAIGWVRYNPKPVPLT